MNYTELTSSPPVTSFYIFLCKVQLPNLYPFSDNSLISGSVVHSVWVLVLGDPLVHGKPTSGQILKKTAWPTPPMKFQLLIAHSYNWGLEIIYHLYTRILAELILRRSVQENTAAMSFYHNDIAMSCFDGRIS